MATEHQIAANRRNARKSSGPRSTAGKRRASRNALRHGLTAQTVFNADRAGKAERLAREIAGVTDDGLVLEYGRAAAVAELDLAQIRRVKIALIERIMELGALENPIMQLNGPQMWRYLQSLYGGKPFVLPDNAATMPAGEPERSVEAVRRALPELRKLARYERAAASRRDKAIYHMIARKVCLDNLQV
jgi:hypothetical protein